MEVSEAKRLRELERENAELKKIVADQTLNIRMLKSLAERRRWDEYNTVSPHGSLRGMAPDQFLQRWTEANTLQQPKSLTG